VGDVDDVCASRTTASRAAATKAAAAAARAAREGEAGAPERGVAAMVVDQGLPGSAGLLV
jgi:hypothetical protein